MSSFRRTLATSPHPLARLARRVYRGIGHFSLPAPMIVVRPIVKACLAASAASHFLQRVCLAEPYFKARCRSYGRGLHTGRHLHYIAGAGDIIVGEGVTVGGKSSFGFAARFADSPTLELGDGLVMSHGCAFSIGRRITIGKRCLIGPGVWMFDSAGHPTDPAGRLAGLPPSADEVKPIRIGDNVWIGRNASIFPGVTIGEGSVVATGSIVTRDVPPYTVVAGIPARPIADLTPASPGVPTAAGACAP